MQFIMLNLRTISSTHNNQLMEGQLSGFFGESDFDPLSLGSLLNPRPPDDPLYFDSSSQDVDVQGYGVQRQNQSLNNASATTSQLETRVRRNERSSNTIFKTSLSQFRKAVLDVISRHCLFEFLQAEINRAYTHKNLSAFPKMVAIIRELFIDTKIKEKWTERVNSLIRKKQGLCSKGKFSQNRLKQLVKNIESMNQALQHTDFMNSLDAYWGNYRQTQKYEKCKQEVSHFQEEFSLAYSKRLQELKEQKQLINGKKKKREVKRSNRLKSRDASVGGGLSDIHRE